MFGLSGKRFLHGVMGGVLSVLLIALAVEANTGATPQEENKAVVELERGQPEQATRYQPVVQQFIATTSANASESCGNKRKCGQMDSCAEACHYLNDCGLSRLDRDHDGIPCESICRRGC